MGVWRRGAFGRKTGAPGSREDMCMGGKVLRVVIVLPLLLGALVTTSCQEAPTVVERPVDSDAQATLAYDKEAKSLIYRAVTAMENGRIDSDTYTGDSAFDYGQLTPDDLHAVEPSIVFTVDDSLSGAATSPSAEAGSGRVDYCGGESEYAVGCVSESGKTFGIMRLASGGYAYYTDGRPDEW